jgi:hypothetical protein
MHKVQQKWSRILIYTNYEGNDVEFADGDGADDKDVDGDTPPYAQGELVVMTTIIFPWWQSQSSMIYPLSRKKRTSASVTTLEKSHKIVA